MKASIKKYDKYLVQSKTLPIFAVPRTAKFNRQAEHNSVESILSLTDEEILLRFQSLTQDELRDLVPVLRATMYVFAMR